MTRVDAGTRGILGLPIPPEALGHLTAPMRIWDEIPSDYFAGVYVQGARAFASLGDGDRTDCALRLYVARNAYGIAGAQDLVDALADRLPPAALRRFAAYG